MIDAANIALVGATGLVGREMLDILQQRGVPHHLLRLFASSQSEGLAIDYGHDQLIVQQLSSNAFNDIDLALFAAGSKISREYANMAIESGATVIDNSSAYRMQEDVPLIIPEVNGNLLDDLKYPAIIANPNCSTIIALMAVSPLHRAAGIKRMVISTYQAASGGGRILLKELEQQVEDHAAGREYRIQALNRPYLFNLFSHNSDIDLTGYNTEEMKLIQETHKIWDDNSTKITATCVRVPVLRAHSESINLTFQSPLTEQDAREILQQARGIRIIDDRYANRFPEPIDASGCDEVLVGRIRSDISQPLGMGLEMFICGDQLRKGAALNAIQIAESMMIRQIA